MATYCVLGSFTEQGVRGAQDDLAVTSLALSAGALGNIRTGTLRLFSAGDTKPIIEKMA